MNKLQEIDRNQGFVIASVSTPNNDWAVEYTAGEEAEVIENPEGFKRPEDAQFQGDAASWIVQEKGHNCGDTEWVITD